MDRARRRWRASRSAVGATVETLSRRRAVAEGLAADNQRLYQEQRGIARTLQHALLPEVPRVDGVQLAARYVAGVDELEVGGDWYDVITRPSGCCVFVVGDVSGQGLPAATTMAALRFAVRAYLAQDDDIATVLTRLRGCSTSPSTTSSPPSCSASSTRRPVRCGSSRPGTSLRCCSAAAAPRCSSARSRPRSGWRARPAPTVTELRVPGPATLLAFTDGAVERRGEIIDTGLERLRCHGRGRRRRASAGRPRPAHGRHDRRGRPRRHGDPRTALGLTARRGMRPGGPAFGPPQPVR